MKKVGIITFHCADNFGAVLQVYALQKVIRDMNFKVEIIDFRPKQLISGYQHSFDFRNKLKNKGLIVALKYMVYQIIFYSSIEERIRSFESFRKKHLNLSKEKYFRPEDLIVSPPKYDYYITGSDQVWNPTFKKRIGNSYFLDFAKNDSKKISYAASIAEKVDDDLINEYKVLLENFDYISIRERSHYDFLKDIVNNDIYVTLDPTLLLDSKDWMEVSKKDKRKEKFILVYDIEFNPELINFANRLSEEMGIGIISYSKKKHFINGIDSFRYKGPDEFLGLFEDADFVITNSFHGTAFSILFKKPFYTIPHTRRGSRMIDLLETLQLKDRIVYDVKDVDKFELKVDFNRPTEILEEKRKESLSFLLKSLNGEM